MLLKTAMESYGAARRLADIVLKSPSQAAQLFVGEAERVKALVKVRE